MAQNDSQILNVRLQTSIVAEAKREATRQYMTVSELVRVALVAYLKSNPETRHEALMYEVVKGRAVMLRCMEKYLTSEEVEQLIELAEQNAAGYMQEQNGGKHP